MSKLSASPAFSTTLLNIASAEGLRQMLPVQKKTVTDACDSAAAQAGTTTHLGTQRAPRFCLHQTQSSPELATTFWRVAAVVLLVTAAPLGACGLVVHVQESSSPTQTYASSLCAEGLWTICSC